ncbi:MAG: hypothetical protein M5U01_29420 [Ardenticatenaceae bacterium]|nr:hypothetical protein [Ardenticatenaceae bacterium]HBY92623.1 hypothetical protein [Chloroflexota bacterium]
MNLQYRQQIALIGALVGAALGALGALIYLDYFSEQQASAGQAARLGFGDMARLATATFALVRQISEIGRKDGKSA